MREKMSKQPPPAPTESTIGPCPTVSQVSRTPWHWKLTQHLRTTRPPPYKWTETIALRRHIYEISKDISLLLNHRLQILNLTVTIYVFVAIAF